MDKRLFLGVALLAASAAAPASALDNVVIGNGVCSCMCETANTGSYNDYDSRGYGCGALEGRTCNNENPQTGLIETGRLWGCGPAQGASNQTLIQGGAVLDFGSAGQTDNTFQVAPQLNGGVMRQ